MSSKENQKDPKTINDIYCNNILLPAMHKYGFYDQEGINDTRYGKAEFKRLLTKLSSNSFNSQKSDIIQIFEDFKGTIEQSDDVTVLGLQF